MKLWREVPHLVVVQGPIMSSQNDVIMNDAAVRGHGQDVDGVLDENTDVVDTGQQHRDQGSYEEHSPSEVLPEHYGHEEGVNQDEACGVPAEQCHACSTV